MKTKQKKKLDRMLKETIKDKQQVKQIKIQKVVIKKQAQKLIKQEGYLQMKLIKVENQIV